MELPEAFYFRLNNLNKCSSCSRVFSNCTWDLDKTQVLLDYKFYWTFPYHLFVLKRICLNKRMLKQQGCHTQNSYMVAERTHGSTCAHVFVPGVCLGYFRILFLIKEAINLSKINFISCRQSVVFEQKQFMVHFEECRML